MMEVRLVRKKKISELVTTFKIYPQVLKNVCITDKKASKADAFVQKVVAKVADALGGCQNIFARESGTEPLVHVMVEASDYDIGQKLVDEIVDVISSRGYQI